MVISDLPVEYCASTPLTGELHANATRDNDSGSINVMVLLKSDSATELSSEQKNVAVGQRMAHIFKGPEAKQIPRLMQSLADTAKLTEFMHEEEPRMNADGVVLNAVSPVSWEETQVSLLDRCGSLWRISHCLKPCRIGAGGPI